MNVYPNLKKDRIFLDVHARTKEEALKEILENLRNIKEISSFEGFSADVMEREQVHTTGIGDGIALPHARSKNVKDFFIAMARSREGIDFASIDKKPAHLIFLMGAPQEALELYLKVLAHLNRLLVKNTNLRSALLEAETAEGVIDLIREAELSS